MSQGGLRGARPARGTARFGRIAAALSLIATFCLVPLAVRPAGAAGPCGPPVVSVIACENSLPGTPSSQWRLSGGGDTSIVGFATSMSVNVGETESFKVKTSAGSYHLDILRMGWYQGNGARMVAAGIRPSASLPQNQPACLTQATTGLVDCGNWGVSASWTVPASAVSGIYLANLVRDDTGGASQVVFVVRNDASHSDLLVQTSDTTWQAYNSYGGNSLYAGSAPAGRAYAVSYNRPFITPSPNTVFDAEYPMVRFLEANGFDASYTSGADVDSRGSLLLNHKVYLSVGHDEYWSGNQRANVEAARAAGVNLAFFSGNEIFWKTRWSASIDGSNTPSRTLVCYKETHAGQAIDPQDPPTWTGTWRDPRLSPPADGGRPENALTGQFFIVNGGTTDIQVPSQYAGLRFWRNTAVAGLSAGQTRTLAPGTGTLGYEWDEEPDNGFRPAGLFDASATTASVPEAFTDYGSSIAPSTRTHHLSLYRAASGALVFGAGTVQWSWGLDASNPSGHAADPVMQQATVNLFADMGAQPYEPIAGLVRAAASTDTTPPSSAVTSPAAGSTVADGARVTVTGTAADTGGVVGGVEVSLDGGSTWHPATGTTGWSYTWVAHGAPSVTIRSRAIDDSGNLETASAGVPVNVSCPCSIWGSNVTPATSDSGDASSVEVGMKFRSDVFGTVSGVRFYKAGTNSGTHVGSLWSAGGQRLATATFSNETTSGWQQVTFANPVTINPNTTYVASYFAPRGHYAQTTGYFYPAPSPPPDGGGTVDSGPLHAQRNSSTSGNGVYGYGASSTFPTNTFNAENYWVDVVFTPSTPPGQPTGVTATAGYASAGVSWTAPATGGPATSYTVTPYVGGTAQPPTVVTGDPAPTGTTVTGLANGTTYTFTVTAANPTGSGPPSAPSNAVTPLASLQIVQNGGFESGLSPWAAGGVAPPVVSTAKAHSGSASAVLGTLTGSEPFGDSTLTQALTLPSGTSTLSFWYWPASTDSLCSGSGCVYDWQEAQLRSTSGATLATLFKLDSNAQAWTQVTVNTSPYAGQTVVLWFNVHQDGANPADDTSMYLDDVAVTGSQPTQPGAPTGVTATAGNAAATVQWTVPGDGGSPITGYTVTPYVGGIAQPATQVAAPATTATVSGLTNGTTYTFTVTATNAVGTGPASAPSNAVTPSAPTPPGAPTGVTATAGSAAATVQWTAPSDGGSPITGYTVTPYVGGIAQPATQVAAPATTATVGGLTNGTTYTFTVTATNALGTGPESAPSNAVTPAAAVVPAFVQQAGAHSGAAGSIAVTPPSAVTAGNRLIVLVGVWNNGGPTARTVTDSAGNGYVELLHFKATDKTEMSVWTAPVTQGGGTRPTITATPTAAADLGIQVLEYSGLSAVADATVVDRLVQATGKTGTSAATVASGPTAATTAGNELAIGCYLDSGFSNTLVAGAGWTQRANVSPAADMEFLAEDQVVGQGATPNATVRTGARTTWLMATVVFKHA